MGKVIAGVPSSQEIARSLADAGFETTISNQAGKVIAYERPDVPVPYATLLAIQHVCRRCLLDEPSPTGKTPEEQIQAVLTTVTRILEGK